MEKTSIPSLSSSSSSSSSSSLSSSSYSSSSSTSNSSSASEQEEAKNEESDDNEECISFNTLSRCAKLFQKVLEYKPTSKVMPKDTYLAIIFFNSTGNSLYATMRYHNTDKDPVIAEFSSIERIVLVPRPIDGFMAYCISNLDGRSHGTIHKGTQQEKWFTEATSHIKVVTLKEGENFENVRWGIKIIYQDRYLYSFKEQFVSLFPSIAKLMLDSSASSPRKVPAVSCGWSTANPNLYKNNRTTILGNIHPFMIETGIATLPSDKKEEVAAMVCRLVKGFSPINKLPSPFFHSDPYIQKARADMASDFLNTLGAKVAKEEGIESCFQAEAVSFILNNYVSFHTYPSVPLSPSLKLSLK